MERVNELKKCLNEYLERKLKSTKIMDISNCLTSLKLNGDLFKQLLNVI